MYEFVCDGCDGVLECRVGCWGGVEEFVDHVFINAVFVMVVLW